MSAPRPGYKWTEAGVIPEGWSCTTLRSLGRVVRGGSPRPAGDRRYFNGSYRPWLTVSSITGIPDSQICVHSTDSALTKAGAQRSRELPSGTFILANSGFSLGVAKVLGMDCCANDGIAALLDLDAGVHSPYLVYYINSITSFLRSTVATGNEQPNLNTNRIGKIVVPLPPLPEQKAIAETLGDADDLIAELEALICKQRDIKLGTMQELLSGHRRLPGFQGEWRTMQLREAADFKKGKGLSKDKIDEGGFKKCIHYGELFTKYGAVIDVIFSRTAQNEGMLLSKREDVLMPTSDVTPNGLATASCVVEEGVALGGDILVIQPDPNALSGAFLANVIRNDRKQIMKLVSGSTVFHLYPSNMAQFSLKFPPLNEQRAIAAVLKDMDDQIALLETKLSKVRAVKQGMMQVLLTGEIRLA